MTGKPVLSWACESVVPVACHCMPAGPGSAQVLPAAQAPLQLMHNCRKRAVLAFKALLMARALRHAVAGASDC